MQIRISSISAQKKDSNPRNTNQPVQNQEETKENEQSSVTPTNEQKQNETQSEKNKESEKTIVDQNTIRPELKEFLEGYESFMDEYCEFMESYNQSDVNQLLKYTSLLQKYTEFAKKAEAWDSRDMTDAETLYYLEVLNRIELKLVKASQHI